MVEDVAYMTKTLGVKTDLDLRSDREIAGMTQSPLGAGVNFIHHSSLEYGGIFASPGRETMAANFRVFCDRANYPVYFHCIAGADRTGTLAYVLNGLTLLPRGRRDRRRAAVTGPPVRVRWNGSQLFRPTCSNFSNNWCFCFPREINLGPVHNCGQVPACKRITPRSCRARG